VTLATNQTVGDYLLSDFIDIGDTYYITWDGRANSISTSGTVSGSVSAVPAGAYNIGLPFDDGNVSFYDELGVVFTNTRPIITVEDKTLTANSYSYHDYLYAEPEITVNGRLYSAATQLAMDMGFYWAGEYLYSYDVIFPVDQSLNVLVDASSGWELEFYDEDYDDVYPWFCDSDGYFSLTMPVTDDGYFFPEDICESGVVYCSDGFDLTNPWSGSTVYLPILYGAMASFQWCPMTVEGPPTTEVKINVSAPTGSVKRGMSYDYDMTLNEGAYRNNIVWSVSNPLYANVVKNEDNSASVKILNKTGTVILTATDKIDGMSYSIILRIT
jgi:hypothetical protein